jgi:hypothetical protein
MNRFLLVIVLLACLSSPVAGQTAPVVDPVATLLTRLEHTLREGPAERYLDLLSSVANRELCAEFAKSVIVPGITRAVVRERDRRDLTGTLPGEGYRLLVEVFLESGYRAQVATWRLDVRRLGSDPAAGWGIVSQEVLATLPGLYRLTLNPRRQVAVRDLAVLAEDLKLAVPDGTLFVAETEAGPTAFVILGRGDMSFTPAPLSERAQLRVVAGTETLQSPFDAAFVRVNPGDADARVTAREMTETVVDPRDLKRAEDVFRQEIVKSFGLDLGELSSDTWSLLPAPGDVLAEIRTRRFETLTYTKSSSEIEDISLYDRKNRRNISVYSSRAHLERFTRFYSEDEKADYVVTAYDVEVRYNPPRRWIEGRTRLAITTVAPSMSSLTIRLAEPLAVQSVVSRELGRLLCVRVRHQDSLVVDLPATVTKGYHLELVVTYSGTLLPQPIDREAITTQLVVRRQEADEDEIPLEESYLFSNRSYWYAQAQTLGYAPASVRVTVPEPWSTVASGELVSVVPSPGPVQRGSRLRQFSFAVRQPVHYLAFIVSRLAEARTERISLKNAEDGLRSSRSPGVYYDDVELRVMTNPRQRSRGREAGKAAANILRFYTSLVGDFPYSALTVVAVERQLPGGHSPAYLAVVATPGPGPESGLRWTDDPGALPDFPDFFIAHELAHQWWGQAVGWKNYHEQWLSEGFAQYFAALYAERSRGRGVFDGIIRRMQQWATDKSDQGPIYLGYRIGHVKRDGRLFRAVVYNKGAMVLHMLRRLVGDQAFFTGLRRFYYTWRFKKAGTDDFRRAMEEASGLDLARFFDQWVLGEGLPQVAFTSRVEDRDGAREAVLRFEQSGDVYDLPVTVTLEYLDNTTTNIVLKLTDRVVETRVPVKGQLRKIDVNRDQAALGVFR